MALKPAEFNRLMNRDRVPNEPMLVVCCMALAAAALLGCWQLIGFMAPLLYFMPGAILGLGLYVAGQIALGTWHMNVLRAVPVVLAGALAWRLALLAYALDGPLRWITASLVGTLGIAAGMPLAWPREVRRGRLFIAMTIAGIAGGVLFTEAKDTLYALMRQQPFLGSGMRPQWPLLIMIWLWQGGVLSTAALTLRAGQR